MKWFNEERLLSLENIEWYFRRLRFKEYQAAQAYILDASPLITTPFRQDLIKMLRDGILLPDTTVYHEAGHILIAKAYGWNVHDLRIEPLKSPLSVAYSKTVNSRLVTGFISGSKNELDILANRERLTMTQGGWAADQVLKFPDEGQYECDVYNYLEIKKEIPGFVEFIPNIRQLARRIVLQNRQRLDEIAQDIRRYISNRDIVIFHKDYEIVLPNDDGE